MKVLMTVLGTGLQVGLAFGMLVAHQAPAWEALIALLSFVTGVYLAYLINRQRGSLLTDP